MSRINSRLLALFLVVLIGTVVYLNSHVQNISYGRAISDCLSWEVRRCDDGRTTGGCTGGNRNCNTGSYCRYCLEWRPEERERPPQPPPPTATPTPMPACSDSDGGSVPGVFGRVTLRAPAIPQTLDDGCVTLQVTNNADGSTSSRWVLGQTGTHVAEKTCTNTVTGVYSDSVLACQYNCTNGACNTATSCGFRSKGDANCDNIINDADYAIWKSKMQGAAYASSSYSADFNGDGAVTIVDYEIWRMTRHN